jgi:hypothetical protein
MSKTMCKWKAADIKKDFSGFKKRVKDAKFACLKCGRVAADKKHLCKPVEL